MDEQKPKEENKPEEPNQPDEGAGDSDSLENPSSTVDETKAETKTDDESAGEDTKSSDGVTDTTHGVKVQKKRRILSGVSKLSVINIYLLIFILIIVLALIITYVSYQRNKSEEQKQEALLTEPLSTEALDQLKQTDVQVGDPKQILTIESNAIFSGNVLIRDSLEVAGQLKLGQPLNVPGITVSGASDFDQLRSNGLDVSGNAAIQGQLSIQQGLTVGGNLNVAGNLSASRLNINNLEVSGNLQINGHITTGGGTPSRSGGSALGGGGTVSISGSDTAGTVNINTGSGAGAGCFVSVSFVNQYSSTPHVVVTPVGSAGGSINYYITRSASGFSICTSNAPGGGKSFAFDYIVVD
ncbi:MAG TPA: hypothetical protein VFX79_02050 [Candidatus Saccharimonadales bacterium]|nr:hypothetical protein [Candidatus Saccharimonadales bacterium]